MLQQQRSIYFLKSIIKWDGLTMFIQAAQPLKQLILACCFLVAVHVPIIILMNSSLLEDVVKQTDDCLLWSGIGQVHVNYSIPQEALNEADAKLCPPANFL